MSILQESDLKPGDQITIEGIVWDTDGEKAEDLGLPMQLSMTIPEDWDEDGSVADLLSDRYGWCIMDPGTISREAAA